MRRFGMVALSGWFWLVGCAPPPSPPEPPFHTVTDMKQLMSWVLDPAADVIWGAAGTISTEEGVQDLAPTTDQGWAEVRNAAAVVAECGNLLMLPGRVHDGEDWMEFAQGLTDIGQKAIVAAEARDSDAVFDVGGELYNVCTACHQRYMLPPEESSAP